MRIIRRTWLLHGNRIEYRIIIIIRYTHRYIYYSIFPFAFRKRKLKIYLGSDFELCVYNTQCRRLAFGSPIESEWLNMVVFAVFIYIWFGFVWFSSFSFSWAENLGNISFIYYNIYLSLRSLRILKCLHLIRIVYPFVSHIHLDQCTYTKPLWSTYEHIHWDSYGGSIRIII